MSMTHTPSALGSVTLIGHPYAPIGKGEHVRCTFRALRSVGLRPGLLDVYGLNTPEPDDAAEFGPFAATAPGAVGLFHLNGDEVEQALATLQVRFGGVPAYRIVYPAWELSNYPQEWARQLERFDEVWAPSRFTADALAAVVARPIVHMPEACEVVLSSLMNRRWFGIPEASYVFMFFYDVRSYAARKNPQAVITAFRRLLDARPYAATTLVIKVNGGELAPESVKQLRESAADLRERAVLIDRTLTDNQVKNLVRLSDCFVSLHRAEGFGRGLCEAMALGKPVIGTGYSGNLDFMTPETSCLVDYRLVPVGEGQYPHWQDQVWAEPDVDQAARFMRHLLDDPTAGAELGRRASLRIRTEFSYRASGRRYSDRLRELL